MCNYYTIEYIQRATHIISPGAWGRNCCPKHLGSNPVPVYFKSVTPSHIDYAPVRRPGSVTKLQDYCLRANVTQVQHLDILSSPFRQRSSVDDDTAVAGEHPPSLTLLLTPSSPVQSKFRMFTAPTASTTTATHDARHTTHLNTTAGNYFLARLSTAHHSRPPAAT